MFEADLQLSGSSIQGAHASYVAHFYKIYCKSYNAGNLEKFAFTLSGIVFRGKHKHSILEFTYAISR